MFTAVGKRALVACSLVGTLLVAAMAVAPQADAATIYACKKKNGTIRLVTKKAKCKKGESKLAWNTTGPAGPQGANGVNGANGTNGTNGANLTTQTPLASGQSESGAFAVADGDSTKGYAATGISFAQPLAAPIAEGHVIYNVMKVTSTHCPGAGRADPGYVCLYESESSGMAFFVARDFNLDADAADRSGFAVFWEDKAAEGYAAGVWTVTAP